MPRANQPSRAQQGQTQQHKRAPRPRRAAQMQSPQQLLQRATSNPRSLSPDEWLTVQRTVGNQQAMQLMRQQTPTVLPKQSNLPTNVVQRFAWDDNPKKWERDGPVDQVTRSREGQAGVYFVKKGGKTVIIKPITTHASEILYANEFAKMMGFDAPNMKSYKINSGEGRALSALLLSHKDGMPNPANVAEQVADATDFLVMDVIDGASIKSLDVTNTIDFIENDEALEQVGRLMVVDVFLGNTDRLVGSYNLGNFFYHKGDQEKGQVHTIDNDMNLPTHDGEDRIITFHLARIESILNKDRRRARITGFTSKVMGVHKHHRHVANRANDTQTANTHDHVLKIMNWGDENRVVNNPTIVASIEAGIAKGLRDFRTLNIEDVTKMKKFGMNNKSTSVAKGLFLYMQARLNNETESEAKAKLDTYLAYRKNRDKTVTGFKWAANKRNMRGF